MQLPEYLANFSIRPSAVETPSTMPSRLLSSVLGDVLSLLSVLLNGNSTPLDLKVAGFSDSLENLRMLLLLALLPKAEGPPLVNGRFPAHLRPSLSLIFFERHDLLEHTHCLKVPDPPVLIGS